MKKYVIKTNSNLMAVAREIVEQLESEKGVELWHPDWVWQSDFAAMSEDECDNVISHEPAAGFRITTAHNQWSGRNMFNYTVFPGTQDFRVDMPLAFYVALFLKRNIPAYPVVVEIGIDFDTILGGMEIPKEERRRGRRTTTRVQRVGGTTTK